MHDIFQTKNRDLLAAFALLLVGAILTAFSAHQVTKIEAPEFALAKSIESGITHYSVKNFSKCVGEISTNLQKQKGYTLDLQGEIRGRYQTISFLSRIASSAIFNPLGQLSSFSFNIDSEGKGKIQISSTGVSPISVTVKAELPSGAYAKTLSLPGPIELVPNINGSGGYFISYPKFKLTQLLSKVKLSEEASNTMPISIERLEGTNLCSKYEDFDANGVIAGYQHLYQMLNQIPVQMVGGKNDSN